MTQENLTLDGLQAPLDDAIALLMVIEEHNERMNDGQRHIIIQQVTEKLDLLHARYVALSNAEYEARQKQAA